MKNFTKLFFICTLLSPFVVPHNPLGPCPCKAMEQEQQEAKDKNATSSTISHNVLSDEREQNITSTANARINPLSFVFLFTYNYLIYTPIKFCYDCLYSIFSWPFRPRIEDTAAKTAPKEGEPSTKTAPTTMRRNEKSRQETVTQQSPVEQSLGTLSVTLPSSNATPHQQQIQEPESQQFTQGNIIISCPKDLKNSLTITNQTETSKEIVCKNIFYIKIFGDFADAKTNDAVKQILEYGVVPPDADSLKRKMVRFSDEVKKNVEKDDLCVTNQFFDWIQREIAEKINHEDVKFGQETDTKKTVIVFMIDNGAILLKGPAKK